ncbi:MAG: DUF1707 domain-containing protein [Actinomycetota bacterium]|nr:DUF1707 domain-containing protein [Actinomycetota bacterium]
MAGYYDRPGPLWSRDWGRPPAPSTTLRVSDAERADVASALCRHFADGRLDEAEFNDRAARTAAAKTQADLAGLMSDLPPLHDEPLVPHWQRRHPMRSLLIGVGVFCVLTWGIAGTFVGLFQTHVPWFVIAVVALVFLRGGRWRHGHRHHEHRI